MSLQPNEVNITRDKYKKQCFKFQTEYIYHISVTDLGACHQWMCVYYIWKFGCTDIDIVTSWTCWGWRRGWPGRYPRGRSELSAQRRAPSIWNGTSFKYALLVFVIIYPDYESQWRTTFHFGTIFFCFHLSGRLGTIRRGHDLLWESSLFVD